MSLLAGCSAGVSGPAEQPAASRPGPTDPVGGPTVRRGDLELEYTLDAATARGSRIGIVPHDRLEFVASRPGGPRHVEKGDRIGRLRVTADALSSLSTAGDGAAASEIASLRSQERTVDAPVSGTLRPSGTAPSLEAPGIDVVAPLSPIQYLRYLSVPFTGSAHVETVLGPMTVDCAALWSVPGAEVSNDTAAELRCRLPSQVETAPGLRATVTISSHTIRDVLLVPNLYIGYDDATDRYFVEVTRGGEPTRVFVQVGPSDGVVRVVRGEVEAGEHLSATGGGASSP